MKRIKATIQVPKLGQLPKQSMTLLEDLPFLKEKIEVPEYDNRSGRGTGSITAEYNEVTTVSTIVDDSNVEKMCTAIAKADFTGKGGDGIVVVSNVDNILNIASKKNGSEAL